MSFIVTANHRIMAWRAGRSQTAEAGALRPGNYVFCSMREKQTLMSVSLRKETIELVQVEGANFGDLNPVGFRLRNTPLDFRGNGK